MSVDKKIINDVIVNLFKNILNIEENSLRLRGVKGVSMTEVHAIEAIGISSSKTMSQVASKLDVTLGTLTTCINRLVSKGYVDRKRDEEDRRIVLVSLTDKGRLVHKIHMNFHEEMIEHMILDLKLDEDELLLKSLEKIKVFFEKEYGDVI